MNRKHWMSLVLMVAATIAAQTSARKDGNVLTNKISEKRIAGADGALDTSIPLRKPWCPAIVSASH